jgi:hypothetical protein
VTSVFADNERIVVQFLVGREFLFPSKDLGLILERIQSPVQLIVVKMWSGVKYNLKLKPRIG